MKHILKLIAVLALAFTVSVNAQGIDSIVLEGNTGTRSATVIVKPGTGVAELKDLAYRVDASNASATVDIRTGKGRVSVNSATSGSGTVLWFDNDPTVITTSDYFIFEDVSLGTFQLNRCTATATTSITVLDATGVATTTDDRIYTLNSRVRRPAPEIASSSTIGVTSIWLPANLPSALTLDGNTTSCQISVSGVRSNGK